MLIIVYLINVIILLLMELSYTYLICMGLNKILRGGNCLYGLLSIRRGGLVG